MYSRLKFLARPHKAGTFSVPHVTAYVMAVVGVTTTTSSPFDPETKILTYTSTGKPVRTTTSRRTCRENTYDAADRTATVSSNGVLLLINRYDAQSRRVRKVAPSATHTYFYDGWNLVEERIVQTNGTSEAIQYVWGKDLSGTLQGAGGVGGLLWLKRNGVLYIPCYDNNGNITAYVNGQGSMVASYVYDAFGNTVEQYGTMADGFSLRFSTKYHDSERDLYYYGYRFYSPLLSRWLNRDPIEEDGGANLYAFCGNDGMNRRDMRGLIWHFSTVKWVKEIESLDFDVFYTLEKEKEKKCCKKFKVNRYVRKFLWFWGGTVGPYVLDHANEGSYTRLDFPESVFAEGDSPEGLGWPYHFEWTQSFKWVAVCTEGPWKNRTLSSIKKRFRTSGHFVGRPFVGIFLEDE